MENYVATTFYLSDVSHEWVRRGAGRERLSMGRWVEKHYADWVDDTLDIKDSGLRELIVVRVEDVARRSSDSALERGDAVRLKYAPPPLYDGVNFQAMFGAWERKAHELDVSEDAVNALAAWTQREGVVQRRAATPSMLASQALELFGRGWVKHGE
jgi:hypothetical protein